MSRSLLRLAQNQRVVFYDELSHFNPLYAAPPPQARSLSLQVEKEYHLRNIRLLSLYFDNIVIMAGNVLNFGSHTSRTVCLEVLQAPVFRDLCVAGIIQFAGWGSLHTKEMITNQIGYSKLYRPDLKDSTTTSVVREVLSSGEVLVREEGVGEEDFIDVLLPRLRLCSETSGHPDWQIVEREALTTQAKVSHVGTMDFFPLLIPLDRTVHQQVLSAYFDAWIDYAASKYSPVMCYESPRYELQPLRMAPPRLPGEFQIASILFSPLFFERFLLRYLDKDEYYRLLNMSALRLCRLRNGDWRVFCDHYHTYLQACSRALWKLHVSTDSLLSTQAKGVQGSSALFDSLLEETLRDLPSFIDAAFLAEIFSQAAVYFTTLPGAKRLFSRALTPVCEYLAKKFKRLAGRLTGHEVYPFLTKVRTAVA